MSKTLPDELESLYMPLGKPKSIGRFPLAFTVPDDLPPVVVEGFTLAWTKAALATLAEIQKTTRSDVKNLPYASLRGFLEVGLKNAVRIESNLGLSKYTLNVKSSGEPEPFAYLTDSGAEAIRKALRPILNDWMTGFIKPFANKEEVPPELLERLEDLRENGDLLAIAPFQSQALPWPWHKETGTTQAKDKHAYRVLADSAARQIAGQEIFQGLGPMKRIISSNGNFTSGVAELITDPITLLDQANKGKFSLVVRLEVVTFPSLHQPLLKVDVSKECGFNKVQNLGQSMVGLSD